MAYQLYIWKKSKPCTYRETPKINNRNRFFYNWDSLNKTEQPLQGMELQEKEAQKYERIQEISLERNHSQNVSVNSRLKAI